jgi:anti-sigma B factor antagonist
MQSAERRMLSRNQACGDGAGMPFQLHTVERERVVLIEAVGRLTLTDGHTKLRDLIHVLSGTGTKKFILNLARVEFIDSFGIGELARTYSVIRQAGGELKLADVSPKVLEVLEISRLNTLFAIYSADDAALQAFAQRT